MRSAEIGKRLYWARSRAKLTVRALGELANLSPSTVTEIENAHHIPGADTLERLAGALKVEPCWLAYGTGRAPAGWRAGRSDTQID